MSSVIAAPTFYCLSKFIIEAQNKQFHVRGQEIPHAQPQECDEGCCGKRITSPSRGFQEDRQKHAVTFSTIVCLQ